MIECIMEVLNDYSNRYNILKGVSLNNEFFSLLDQLYKFYLEISNKNELRELIKTKSRFETYAHQRFYYIFKEILKGLLNNKYTDLKVSKNIRSDIISQNLHLKDLTRVINKYDYFFFGAEEQELLSDSLVSGLTILSNTLVVGILADDRWLRIYDLKNGVTITRKDDEINTIVKYSSDSIVYSTGNLIKLFDCYNETIKFQIDI